MSRSRIGGRESAPGVIRLIREDWETHHRRLLMPGLHALVVHRLGVWAREQPWLVRKTVGAVYTFVNDAIVRNVYGVEISRTTVIGRRLLIGHHQGVILGHAAVIGDDCLIRQGLTLGQSNDSATENDQPIIGHGVHFGANATVIGAVRIGDGAQIGAGAVVTRDVPGRSTAFTAPARILRAVEDA